MKKTTCLAQGKVHCVGLDSIPNTVVMDHPMSELLHPETQFYLKKKDHFY